MLNISITSRHINTNINHHRRQCHHLPPSLPTTTTLPTPATTIPKSTPTSTTITNSCKKANRHNVGPNDDCVVWALCKFFFCLFLIFINLLIGFFCFLGSSLLLLDAHLTLDNIPLLSRGGLSVTAAPSSCEGVLLRWQPPPLARGGPSSTTAPSFCRGGAPTSSTTAPSSRMGGSSLTTNPSFGRVLQ
jgi:hypothetical protein